MKNHLTDAQREEAKKLLEMMEVKEVSDGWKKYVPVVIFLLLRFISCICSMLYSDMNNHDEQKSYQKQAEVDSDFDVMKISNIFDSENAKVCIIVETDGEEITHFWIEASDGQKLDLAAMLPSRDRILIKKSTINRFSAALNDTSKAILEWKWNSTNQTTEDILAFIHELGHAMDGVQVSMDLFMLRFASNNPQTLAEKEFYVEDELTAQKNAKRILNVLIKRKVLKDTEELKSLISNWDADYVQRIKTKIAS